MIRSSHRQTGECWLGGMQCSDEVSTDFLAERNASMSIAEYFSE